MAAVAGQAVDRCPRHRARQAPGTSTRDRRGAMSGRSRMPGAGWPVARTNRAYSSCVTAKRPMKNSLTKTRWTGRSSSSASAAPMKKSPAGMRARFGAVGEFILARVATALPCARCMNVSGNVSIVQDLTPIRPQKRSKVTAMRVEPFAMERMQSTYENQVEFNLSESGVHPLRLGELVHDTAARDALLAEALRYTQTNGTPPLRAQIASMYPGATADHILVTNGGSEANLHRHLESRRAGRRGGDDGARTTCRCGASRARSARRSRNGRSSTTARGGGSTPTRWSASSRRGRG